MNYKTTVNVVVRKGDVGGYKVRIINDERKGKLKNSYPDLHPSYLCHPSCHLFRPSCRRDHHAFHLFQHP
jgi:hypothetical protein